jgi:hypothetical protein
MRFAWLLLVLGALPSLALAQTYKWVDEKGQLHYTQTPPVNRKYDVIGSLPPPSTSNSNQEDLNKSLERDIKDRPKLEEAAAKAEQEKAKRQETCKKAMEQLAYLESRTARRLSTTDAEGNYSRMTEEQFQERRAAEQKKISQNCQ